MGKLGQKSPKTGFPGRVHSGLARWYREAVRNGSPMGSPWDCRGEKQNHYSLEALPRTGDPSTGNIRA